MNPELQQALRGFVPVIGSEEDLRIVNDLTKLHRKLSTIDTVLFREIESSKRRTSELTSKMREIQKEEEYLIKRIINRNFDF